jgi:CRISPR-associated protein Cas1
MSGLNPCIGWFHESRPGYHALACDLQEEFRFIVDSLVLFLVHRNMVSPDDFTSDAEESLPCLMKKEFRKVFLRQLEEKFLTEFTPDGDVHAINYRSFFLRQARQIAGLCHDPEKTYQPLRIR